MGFGGVAHGREDVNVAPIKSIAEDHGRKPVGESVRLPVAERCKMIEFEHGKQTQCTWGVPPRVSCCLDPQALQKDTEGRGKGFC